MAVMKRNNFFLTDYNGMARRLLSGIWWVIVRLSPKFTPTIDNPAYTAGQTNANKENVNLLGMYTKQVTFKFYWRDNYNNHPEKLA
jgi:hypothetical protein